MKVELNKVITAIGGKPIPNEGKDLTVKDALLMALILPNPKSDGVSPEEAVKTRKLFDKIDRAELEIELKSDEIVKLKDVLSKRLSELVAGAAILALEPE